MTWGLQSIGVSIKPLPTALIAIPIGITVTAILTLAIDKVVYRYHRERKLIRNFPYSLDRRDVFMGGLIRFIIGLVTKSF